MIGKEVGPFDEDLQSNHQKVVETSRLPAIVVHPSKGL